MFIYKNYVKIVNKVVRCLGIFIGYDKEKCFNNNWIKIYYDIEKLFEFWKRRKLILFGNYV